MMGVTTRCNQDDRNQMARSCNAMWRMRSNADDQQKRANLRRVCNFGTRREKTAGPDSGSADRSRYAKRSKDVKDEVRSRHGTGTTREEAHGVISRIMGSSQCKRQTLLVCGRDRKEEKKGNCTKDMRKTPKSLLGPMLLLELRFFVFLYIPPA